MPKTTWFSTPSQAVSKPYKALYTLIFGNLAFNRMSQKDLIERTGLKEGTLRNRKKDLGSLKLDELRKIGRALDIPIEELRACIRY